MISRRNFVTILSIFGFMKDQKPDASVASLVETEPPVSVPDVLSNSDPDPSKVLEEARALAASGDFEEALSKHIWYHANALRIQPAQVGVRLSFALWYWEELGEKYPKAREALIEIQERNRKTLDQGKCDAPLFQEIARIDHYLGEPSSTVESFRKLRKIDAQVAAKCYDLAEEALAEQGAYAECTEYLIDPSAKLKRIVEFRKVLLIGDSLHELRKSSADADFTDKVSRLITILAKSGRLAEAEKIRESALLTLDNQTIRNAG